MEERFCSEVGYVYVFQMLLYVVARDILPAAVPTQISTRSSGKLPMSFVDRSFFILIISCLHWGQHLRKGSQFTYFPALK